MKRFSVTFGLAAESIGSAYARARQVLGSDTAMVVAPAPVGVARELVASRTVESTRWEARAIGRSQEEILITFSASEMMGPAGVVLVSVPGRAEPVRAVLSLDQLSELLSGMRQFPHKLIDEMQSVMMRAGWPR